MPETEGKNHAFIHARLHAVRWVSRSPHMRDLARGGQHPPSEAAATGVVDPPHRVTMTTAAGGVTLIYNKPACLVTMCTRLTIFDNHSGPLQTVAQKSRKASAVDNQ